MFVSKKKYDNERSNRINFSNRLDEAREEISELKSIIGNTAELLYQIGLNVRKVNTEEK